MRELIVNTLLTLDGVMQAPGGPDEDPSGGFDQGGWSFGYWDEQMQSVMGESMSKPIDLVLGRKTYEIFAAHWPHVDDPGAEPLNAATKHVASTTRKALEWENSKLIEGEVPEGVRALKEGGRPRASGAWQCDADPDAARARADRRVSPVDLPARARQGKAAVLTAARSPRAWSSRVRRSPPPE